MSKCSFEVPLADGKTMCDAPGQPDYMDYRECDGVCPELPAGLSETIGGESLIREFEKRGKK